MGDECFERYLHSFEEDAPVSIRLNPMKTKGMEPIDGEPVPWCRNGYYLKQRPNFTMDPLFHAGCYYVQEAASMFLDEVLRQHLTAHRSPFTALDMCAAPGGKSTLLRAALPADSTLISNEPIRQRASILAENVQKWGYPNHVVTNNYPQAFRASKFCFDVILCDVPCSGEGMFRKDPATIREWSPQNVEKCWRLQREIVADAWQCLNPGGLLIYSTCTFNTKENEENISWILTEYDAQVLAVETKAEWNITGSLLEGFTAPVYRFIPGISRGEGLFLCLLQKGSNSQYQRLVRSVPTAGTHSTNSWYNSWYDPRKPIAQFNIICQNTSETTQHSLTELSYQQAISYLRGEALRLSDDTPRGEVTVCFLGHPLGMVKNIGSRANNLYPKPWRIKTTHIPEDYEPILR